MQQLLGRFSQNLVENGTLATNKPLDFGGNPVHVTLGLWVGLGLQLGSLPCSVWKDTCYTRVCNRHGSITSTITVKIQINYNMSIVNYKYTQLYVELANCN